MVQIEQLEGYMGQLEGKMGREIKAQMGHFWSHMGNYHVALSVWELPVKSLTILLRYSTPRYAMLLYTTDRQRQTDILPNYAKIYHA